MEYFIEGFILQASLILALGAQNLYVIEAGIHKKRPYLVAAVCTLCDFCLVFLGVLGTSFIFSSFPQFKILLGSFGVLFLLYYGLQKISTLFQPKKIENTKIVENSLKKVILTTLGFSLLNPHVYLDTIVLIGGYAGQFAFVKDRLAFGGGASLFSFIWFFLLVSFAGLFSRLLQQERSQQFFSTISGLILLILSFKLGQEVYSWVGNGETDALFHIFP